MKQLVALIIILILTGCVSLEEIKTEEETKTPSQAPTEAQEYHYTGKFCSDCHEPIPQEGGDKFLKYGGDFNILCKCHLNEPGNYIHPVEIVPSKEKKTKLPATFPLRDGKLTCLTCHDIYRQCVKRRVEKISLRGAPYPRRSDFCYNCHDETSYMMLDPHVQLNAKGDIIVEKCLYCHTEKPDEKRAHYEDVQFIGDLEMLCQRCHVIRGNHAGNVDHLVKPSDKRLAVMKAMEKKFDIILPLDANGKMTCITCHNPHDKGVIPVENPAGKGAGSKYRHRLPDRLCIECHEY